MPEDITKSTDITNNTDKGNTLSDFNVSNGNNSTETKSYISKIVEKVESIVDLPLNTPKIHDIKIRSILDLILIDDEGTLTILSNDYFRDIRPELLKKALLEKINEFEGLTGKKVKKLDISEFNDDEDKYLKENIYNIIGNNFPLLEVSRLTEGTKVVDLTFIGIKTLNDEVSKEFVDLFSNKLKEYLHNNFHKNAGTKPYGRIIRDNYKHMTFSMNSSKNLFETIFSNERNKEALLERIFNELDINELSASLENAKIKDKNVIKELLFKEFNLGIGTTIVEKSDIHGDITLTDKMKAFYKAEISSRNKYNFGELSNNLEYDFENIKVFAEKALEKEKEIVDKYEGKKFSFNSTVFDIVVNGKINNILLRYVRKGEDILNPDLKILVEDYILNLNSGFDFIAPFVDIDQLDDIGLIESQVDSGVIDTDLLKNTYKNTLSIDALKSESKGKEGLRIFIDIVDMGIMNLNDFRKLALKVSNGEIDSNNIGELLLAGKTATNRFQNLVTSIKEGYQGAKISLGGDEIFMFIPGKSEKETKEIISDITHKLKTEDLVGRISNSTNKNNDRIFDSLDNFTSINKFFEKKVERIINDNGNVKVKKVERIINDNGNVKVKKDGSSDIKTLKDLESFTSINLNINRGLQRLISENTNNFIIDLKDSIDYNMMKAIITGRVDRHVFGFTSYKRDNKGNKKGKISDFKINITKANNNELIISIK